MAGFLAALGGMAANAGMNAATTWANGRINAFETRRLRSSYYQDMVKSMKSAGINPIYAFSGGGSGMNSPAVSSVGSQNAFSSAQDSSSASDLRKEQGYREWTGAELNRVQHDLIQQQKEQSAATVRKLNQETALTEQLAKKERENTNSAQMSNVVQRAWLDANTKAGQARSGDNQATFDLFFDNLGKALGGSGSLIKGYTPWKRK